MNFTLPGGFSMPSGKLLVIIGVVGAVVGLGLMLFSRWWNYCPGCHGDRPFNSLSSDTPSKTETVEAAAHDSETSEHLAAQPQEEDDREESGNEDGGVQGIHSSQDYSPV